MPIEHRLKFVDLLNILLRLSHSLNNYALLLTFARNAGTLRSVVYVGIYSVFGHELFLFRGSNSN